MASAPPPSTSRVSQYTIEAAVDALLKWKDAQKKSQKPQLLPGDDFLYLILTLNKIPPKGGRTNPHKIPLPHPFSTSSELCLIIDDRPTSKLTSETAKKKIKSENIPVSKVIKLSKLKTNYKPFEAKRKLCDSYEIFFTDKRVVPLLPKLLGKQFFKKKKLPLPVDLTHKNWKEQIEKGCGSALLYMKTGTCSVVKVGKVEMEEGKIVENLRAAIDGVVEFVPKKWEGVRSLHLKFSESLALPVYQALPDMKLRIEGIKGNLEEVEEEGGGEFVVKEERTGDGKLGRKKESKKGRIHEVRYMDASVDEGELSSDNDEDENGSEKSENEDLGGGEFVGKKRKKEDSAKGRVLGELKKEKPAKKVKGHSESKKGETDDLGSAEFGVRNKKKGDSMKGQVLGKKSGEKRAKRKKGGGEGQKIGELALKGIEASGGKKGKKKSDLETTLKNAAVSAKTNKSKKRQSAQ